MEKVDTDDNKDLANKNDIRIKGIIKSVLFFTIAFIILFIISKVYTNIIAKDNRMTSYKYRSTSKAILQNEDKYDTLVVGDSLTYTAVSPLDMWKEYGFTGYALSSPGEVIEESYNDLKDILKKQSPKVVAIETNVIFKDNGFIGNVNDVVNEKQNDLIPALKYHDIWKPLFIVDKYKDYTYEGYNIQDRVANCSNINNIKKSDKKANVNKINKYYLDKMVDICKERGCKVVLLSLPKQTKAYGSDASQYEEYNFLKDYAKEKDIDIYNMNILWYEKKFDIDWSKHCCDTDEDIASANGGEHLNAIGAKIASKDIGKYLSSEYELKDHRQDDNYKKWHEKYDTFNKEREKVVKEMQKVINTKEATDKNN